MNTPLTAGTHNLKVQFKRLIKDFSKITDIPKHQCPVDQKVINPVLSKKQDLKFAGLKQP